MPRWSFAVFLAILGVLAVVALLRRQAKWQQLCLVLLCAGASLVVIYAPHLLTPQVWIVARAVVPVFSLGTMFIVALAWLLADRSALRVLLVAAAAMLLINAVQIQTIAANHFVTNALDQAVARELVKAIEVHERETGTIIRRIATTQDESPSWAYPGVDYVIGDTNVRAMLYPWSAVSLLRFVSGREFIIVPMSKEAKDLLLADERNWTSLEVQDQMIFDGDTAYIVMY